MRPLLLKTFIVLALTAPGLALADPPALVGRISLAEGQVALATDGNEDAGQALLNWPVTSDSRIVTERGALAEFRVGAAAVRVAADSELEVTRLDDDNFRLRLNYGSAAVRIVDPEMLRGFELRTDQARVTLTRPGWLRVDAQGDMSVVSVIAGRAEVEGGGSSTTLEPGRRAEVGVDDLHLGALRRDAFDNWPQLADTPALRYVSQSMTGYEELDRYGNWRVDPDYGPLWQPRELPTGWAPYRYGRWTFLQPWGWTWVDDAPWGYAPSHYGRWVLVGQRWCWAPGRVARPAWSPALVGWVGGSQWQVTFAARDGRRSGPGVGWFPLSPRDTYAPAYRVSPEHRRRLEWRHDGAGPRRASPQHQERAGLTVVSAEQFRARNTVPVTRAPQAVITGSALKSMPLAVTPPPAAIPPPRSEGPRRLAPRLESPRLESPQPERAAQWRAEAERRTEEGRNTGAPASGLLAPAVPAVGVPARMDERRFEAQRSFEQERRFEQERHFEQQRRVEQQRRIEQERVQQRHVAPASPPSPSSLATEPRAPMQPAPLTKPERVDVPQPEPWRGPRRLEPARVAEPRPAPPAAVELRERPEPGQVRQVREAALAPQQVPQPAPAQLRAPAPVARPVLPAPPQMAPSQPALAPAQLRPMPPLPAPLVRPVVPAPPQVERPPTRAPRPEMSQRHAEHEQAALERAKARQERREDGQPR